MAVPVTARDLKNILEEEADEFIAVHAPLMFGAVGAFYEQFYQTSDEEVIKILQSAA